MRVNFKEWAVAAGIRALRTFAEAALAYIGTGAVLLGDVNWLGVLSAGVMGAVISVLMAMTGLPEVKEETAEETRDAYIEEKTGEKDERDSK